MSKRLNAEVKIVFLDHSEDFEPGKPIKTIVYGKIVKETKDSYTVVCWDLDSDDEDVVVGNRKIFTVLKNVILEFYEVSAYKKIRLRVKQVSLNK